MTSNVASLFFRYLNPSESHPNYTNLSKEDRLTKLNKVMRYIAVGTNQVLVLTVTTLALGHHYREAIFDNILKPGFLFVDDENKQKMLKLASIALRRTQRTCKGVILKPQQMAATCYFEVAFGRSTNVTDWDNEIKVRTAPPHHMQCRQIEEIQITDSHGKIQYLLPWQPQEHMHNEHMMEPDSEYYQRFENKMEMLIIYVDNSTSKAYR